MTGAPTRTSVCAQPGCRYDLSVAHRSFNWTETTWSVARNAKWSGSRWLLCP